MQDAIWSQLATLGGGGLLAAVILFITFEFLKLRNGRETNEYEHHTEKALEKLLGAVDRQTELLQDMRNGTRANCAALRQVSDEIRELRQYFVNSQQRS